MKNIIVASSVLFLAMVSCKKAENHKAENQAVTEVKTEKQFLVDSISINDSVQLTKPLTVAYSKKVLVFEGVDNKVLLDSIYKNAEIVTTDFSKENLQKEVQKLKQKFFDDTKNSLKDYSPDFKQTWVENSEMKIQSNKNDFLTLNYTKEGFSGGAHGYHDTKFKVFDLKNNTTVQLKDIVYYPKIDWKKILMESFKKNVSKDQQAMLLEKVIPVNNNFYFDEKNIYFIYNQYEITAYAAGVVTIPISWETFDGNLNTEFKKRIGIK